MVSSLVLALLAMVFWGFWALFAQLSSRSLMPETAMMISYAASVPIALGYITVRNQPIDVTSRGLVLALVAGVFAAAGGISFYAGLSRGDISAVTTISALYFVVATLLGIVAFGDSVGATDVAGMALAVCAVYLISL